MANSIGIGFDLVGDWVGTELKLKKLPIHIERGIKKANREIAEEIYARVVGHIYNQDLKWAPLSQLYETRKSSKWGDTGILMASQKMVSSIKVYTDGMTSSIGIKAGLQHPFSKKRVAEIAALHESGTSRMPARPVWGPTYREMGGDKGITRKIAKELNIYLKSKGYPVIRLP